MALSDGGHFRLGSVVMAELTAPTGQRCIACGSPLEARASICPVCRSWQSQWKNHLVFLGGIAGFLVILATALTYVANTVYTILSQRDNAEILQLQYPGYQIFDNSGTIPILLSHLELYWHGGNTTVIVGQSLAPKQMFYKADALDKMKSAYPSAALVANASGDGTALLPKAAPFPYTNKCYSLVFFSDNAPELTELNSFFAPNKVKLATVRLDSATLFYYSTNDRVLHQRPFPAVAAFLDLKKKECAAAAPSGKPPP
jgi:hypothetical protein